VRVHVLARNRLGPDALHRDRPASSAMFAGFDQSLQVGDGSRDKWHDLACHALHREGTPLALQLGSPHLYSVPGVTSMQRRVAVCNRFPEAQAVEEPLSPSPGPWVQRGRWFIYAGSEPDSRVLGHGVTEDQAWANAARRLAKRNRKVKWLLAG
jgi:hypothetical protein